MTVMLTALAALAQAGSAPSVEIENFIGEVRIETGQTLNVRVEREGEHDTQIANRDGGVQIDGNQSIRRIRCYGRWGEDRVGTSRGSAEPFEAWPLLIITTPDPAALTIKRSVISGTAGDLGSLDAGLSHCSSFTAGDIAGPARVGASGSGDITLGEVGADLSASLSGSGEVDVANVGGDVNLSVSGSGDMSLGNAQGDLDVRVSGSGEVQAGNVARVDASISGSGDIRVGDALGGVVFSASGNGDLRVGAVSDVSVRSSGSSHLEVARMNGALDMRSSGSGSVRVQEGRATRFQADLGGSADLWFGGIAEDVSVSASGGSDIYVLTVEGNRNVRTSGGGSFNTGR